MLIIVVAKIEEPKDKIMVGEKIVPVTKVPINDFAIETIKAPLISLEYNTIRITIFAKPNFINGTGLGMNASKTNKVEAKEA